MNYDTIRPYYALLQDHPEAFAYYGKPKDAYYLVYDAVNEAGDPLVVSYECNEICEELAYLLKDVVPVALDAPIPVEQKEYLCTKASEKEVQTMVLSLIDSLSENDALIESLQDGFFVRLLGYLLTFSH